MAIDSKLRAKIEAEGDASHQELLAALDEQELIHQTVLEHSSSLENELQAQNERIAELVSGMRRYLSSALIERISNGADFAQAGRTQRRNLTIFFSDISGFTELTDTVEPETLSQILNSYLSEMATICQRYGGVLDKFIGDAVMIFFGDEDESDPKDSATRCVKMAIEMQASVVRLQSEWAKFGAGLSGLRVRMGINSGYATVGNFGSTQRMDYTVIGGNVNVASRLEHQAPLGGICISGSTYALVQELIDVQAMGAIQVKGVAHPVESFSVLGLKESSLDQNPFYSENESGFSLSNLRCDTRNSGVQREQMREALKRALAWLAQQS